MDADTTKALKAELDGDLITTHRYFRYRYLEGRTVINQANRIFGFDGWGYQIAGPIEMKSFEVVDKNTGEKRTAHAYNVAVTVTVKDALPRTDIGFCTVSDQTADGHDTAMKGAVTDALKRALRTFGNQFGNCLYDKDWQPEGEEQPAPAQHRNGQPAPARGGQDRIGKDAGKVATSAQSKKIERLGKADFGSEWPEKRDEAIDGLRKNCDDKSGPITRREADLIIGRLEKRAEERKAGIEDEVDFQ
ncbi:MAG: Rad52/Rad22 family DNA repair protein [Gammaproteobacteria bacterium]|nr:Rad52/Rad22 family DNA repair protein [Gammaproteobacteria bacterium]